MRLYLSSYRIPNIQELESLVGRKLSDVSCGIVMHAKDYYSDHVRAIKVHDKIDQIQDAVGFKEIIEINLYEQDAPSGLGRMLDQIDVLFVAGGNAFCLNEAVQSNTSAGEIRKRVLSGQLVYVGESAGAVLAGSSLETVDRADDARFSIKTPSYRGMSLIDSILIPHSESPHFQEYSDFALDYFKGNEKAVFITDAEAYVVNGEKRKIVSGTDNLDEAS